MQDAQLRNSTRRKSKWRLFFCELYQIRFFEEIYRCEMSKKKKMEILLPSNNN